MMRMLSRSSYGARLNGSQSTLAISLKQSFKASQGYIHRVSGVQPIPSQPLTIEEALNCNGRLTIAEKGINLCISLGSCGIAYFMSRRPLKEMLSISHLAYMILFGSIISFVVYNAQKYGKYSRLKRSEMELKSHNSTWIDMAQKDGGTVKLHCRVEKPNNVEIRHAIHCVHGFGSHSFSFSFIQKRLANAVSSLVTSHDICGFGLSQRPFEYLPYTMKFHGSASVYILDRLLQDIPESQKNGQKVRKILIGHSLGCSAVAEALIEGNDIAGAIMIAPAILSFQKKSPKKGAQRGNTIMETFESLVENEDSILDLDWDQIGTGCRKILLSIKTILLALVTEILTGILYILSPLLKIFLGVAVFPRAFWDFGLASAVKTRDSITNWDMYLDNYRIPVLVKGWEDGLLRFVLARISRKKGIIHALKQIWHSEDSMPQVHRLADTNNVPILIIHGRQDMIVPIINSRRLAEYIPNTQLKVLEYCGHMPHEELPSEFLHIAEKFIQGL